jgi:hypothetical protein
LLRCGLMDSLVDAITELVIKELEKAGGTSPRGESPASAAPAPALPSRAPSGQGPRLLVVAGPEPVPEQAWTGLAAARVSPSVLIWPGFPQPRLPAQAARYPLETRDPQVGASRLVKDYAALCLLGSDLPVLGSLAALGSGGLAPAAVAVAGVSSGLPVFCESAVYEQVRRHSARLAPGFVRSFEEAWRQVVSFGVEMGTAAQLTAFLERLGGRAGGAAPAATTKGAGRDVVTTEDVEAARRAGLKTLQVGMGAIVTPLARQQAAEWGIEVKLV